MFNPLSSSSVVKLWKRTEFGCENEGEDEAVSLSSLTRFFKQRENKETKGFEEAWAYHFAGGNRRGVRSELRQPFGEEGVLRVYRGKERKREIRGFLTS